MYNRPPTFSPESNLNQPQVRRTLIRVLLVQAVTLGLLWWLQAHYLR